MKNDNIDKNVLSKKTGRSNITDNNSDNDVDYKNATTNSRSKSTSNKSTSSGNIKEV